MTVLDYHDGTKHQFERFARSLGYLDWASQPNPFRGFGGAPVFPLYPRPDAGGRASAFIGDLLRHSVGLSAWKRFGASRWSLRVNPSSGNLHPTETYIVCGPMDGLASAGGVYHYAADRHALEQRCAFEASAWSGTGRQFLVVLTSIHWREAWKYGERAFRYCQHDVGHAIAAVRFAAAAAGLNARLLPEWSHRDIAALAGIDRDEDYVDAERDEPACIIAVGPELPAADAGALCDAARRGQWTGRASQLSEDHVQWTFIDDVARITEDAGRRDSPGRHRLLSSEENIAGTYPNDVILRRRSALAFDARSSMSNDRWHALLARAMPDARPPWDAMWWDARVHLALFVHRVDGIAPGLYVLVRNARALDALRRATTRPFAWTRASETLPLFLLAQGDCRSLAQRVSCDQDIAGDGFFSLGMIAEFEPSLAEFGSSFYRHLFWEAGIVGQTLYLEAEAAGARATGIGCFYDDPVHDVLGIRGHAFQSLYHFAVGVPIEDTRLATDAAYPWETATR